METNETTSQGAQTVNTEEEDFDLDFGLTEGEETELRTFLTQFKNKIIARCQNEDDPEDITNTLYDLQDFLSGVEVNDEGTDLDIP